MSTTAIPENAIMKSFTSYCREQQQQTMVDCNKGLHAKQQPTNFLVASQEQATIAKQQHHQCNDHFLCPMSYCKKLQQW
jgi:hypothetical protein